ncbi:MAG: FHA domain-containing protein [Leptolyngbya sp. IPPAS B-1204]|uniref:FHA domain-containing protein n=1 Tax=Leptolyngbya sp. NK1-12 TaxID=2547451 RepID=A0AA97ALX4_9CYAN|nr:FHA domain-containing protein [Elainella sp. C42_A2020_010]RNJ66591.1 MAG: FHA domain-containing protein [Leptolyngbya sp. IPPAS B-1204]WNZ25097.1 FHA domain-containing protein [Leptolyngbya sp. NK1-12]
MTTDSLPLIQTITPERWAGFSMNFIGAGYVGLLVKNGQLVRKLEPGRHVSFALPLLEQCEIVLVDSKIRHLDVVSQGDFVSRDQYLVNISLSVMYQVVDPKRVALELSDPIAALTSAIKDNLGVVVNQLRLEELNRIGRVQIRDYLLAQIDSFYTLGFNLDDVRVSDISFPQKRGVIRQLEGLTARAELEHEANLQAQIAETFVLRPGERPPQPIAPARYKTPLPPTTLAIDSATTTARLIHCQSGAPIAIAANPFTIGREAHHTLVSSDELCSRNHACIEQVENTSGTRRYRLTDLGSSNGTYLNQQRLTPHQAVWLSAGDRIKIGTEEWIFEVGAV